MAEKLVKLVTTDIFTPFRKDEVFAVPEDVAQKLLQPNMERTDFGPRYPVVKVRRLNEDSETDQALLRKYLTQDELKAQYPELVEVEADEALEDDGDTEVAAATSKPSRRRAR